MKNLKGFIPAILICVVAINLVSAQNTPQQSLPPNQPASVIFIVSTADSMKKELPAIKGQLKDSLSQLTDDLNFNVLAFGGDKVLAMKKDAMIAATDVNKTKGAAFIDGLKTNGASNPIPAIKRAIKQKPPRIFFILDGLDPKIKSDDLIKAFEQPDADQPVRVKCIYLVDQEDKPLEAALKTITTHGGGMLTIISKADMN